MKNSTYLASLALMSSLYAIDLNGAYRCCMEAQTEEHKPVTDLGIPLEELINENVLKRLADNSREAILHVSAILNGILGAIAHKDNHSEPELFAHSVNTAVAGFTNIIILGAQTKKSKKIPKNALLLTKKIEKMVRSIIQQMVTKKIVPHKK